MNKPIHICNLSLTLSLPGWFTNIHFLTANYFKLRYPWWNRRFRRQTILTCCQAQDRTDSVGGTNRIRNLPHFLNSSPPTILSRSPVEIHVWPLMTCLQAGNKFHEGTEICQWSTAAICSRNEITSMHYEAVGSSMQLQLCMSNKYVTVWWSTTLTPSLSDTLISNLRSL